jgi:hypothetical protein
MFLVELGAVINVASSSCPGASSRPSSQECLYGVKDLLGKPMLLQQVAEAENRGLIRDSVTDQLDPGKAAHGGYLDHCLFHRRIAERIPLLQQVDPQHGGHRIGRPSSSLACFGVVGAR